MKHNFKLLTMMVAIIIFIVGCQGAEETLPDDIEETPLPIGTVISWNNFGSANNNYESIGRLPSSKEDLEKSEYDYTTNLLLGFNENMSSAEIILPNQFVFTAPEQMITITPWLSSPDPTPPICSSPIIIGELGVLLTVLEPDNITVIYNGRFIGSYTLSENINSTILKHVERNFHEAGNCDCDEDSRECSSSCPGIVCTNP